MSNVMTEIIEMGMVVPRTVSESAVTEFWISTRSVMMDNSILTPDVTLVELPVAGRLVVTTPWIPMSNATMVLPTRTLLQMPVDQDVPFPLVAMVSSTTNSERNAMVASAAQATANGSAETVRLMLARSAITEDSTPICCPILAVLTVSCPIVVIISVILERNATLELSMSQLASTAELDAATD
jgi:hypothetical protein